MFVPESIVSRAPLLGLLLLAILEPVASGQRSVLAGIWLRASSLRNDERVRGLWIVVLYCIVFWLSEGNQAVIQRDFRMGLCCQQRLPWSGVEIIGFSLECVLGFEDICSL